MSLNKIRHRILDISYKHQLCHLGSCFSCLPTLYKIYQSYPNDIIILSNGHAGLSQYCVLEYFFNLNAEDTLIKHGIHPNHDPQNKIYCSTGSLGCGLSIATGYALSGNSVHCIISDGECAEGIIWESLSFIEDHKIPINIYVNINGWAAYKKVDSIILQQRLKMFLPSINIEQTSNAPFPDDLSAHYEILTDETYIKYKNLIDKMEP